MGGGLARRREQSLSLGCVDTRVIEIDRKIAANRVEGHALQVQRPVAGMSLTFVEEQILAFVETHHAAAEERSSLGVLRKQYGVVQHEMRELVDDHLHEALVVT